MTNKILNLQHAIHSLLIKNCEKNFDDGDDMPNACFQKVERIISLKGRKNIFMDAKSFTKDQLTNPEEFFPGAASKRESLELFYRTSHIGCCETENFCALMTIHRKLKEYDSLMYKDKKIIDYGICISRPSIDLLSIIYEWDPKKSVEEWETIHQKAVHEFIYFRLDNNDIIYLDLTIVQFGVFDSFIEEPDIGYISVVFDYSSKVIERYPAIYSGATLKSNKDIISRESDNLDDKIEKLIVEGTIDQQRIAHTMKRNLNKMKNSF